MSKFSSNERYLILNADDFGMCHSANQAIIKMLNDNVIASTSIMPVCPWFQEAAEYASKNPRADVGVHLTFTSEWKYYKWGSVNKKASLVTDQGYLPQDCGTFEQKSAKEDVIDEIWQQINKVKDMGIDFNNIDNHMGSLYGLSTGRSFLPEVFDICSRLHMPFRFPKYFSKDRVKTVPASQLKAFEGLRDLALSKNVRLIDYLIEYPFHMQPGETYESYLEMMTGLIRNLEPGISELYVHPSVESDEIRAINPSWQKRVMEYHVFYEDRIQRVISEEGIKLVSWRDLREDC